MKPLEGSYIFILNTTTVTSTHNSNNQLQQWNQWGGSYIFILNTTVTYNYNLDVNVVVLRMEI